MTSLSRTLFISIFCAVLFLSSSLLFVIQPIIGKIVTAKYGGGAQVWCLSLFFFQFILFSGYFFSYFLCRQKIKTQIIIYSFLIVLLFGFAEIPWGNEWAPKNFDSPIEDLLLSYIYFLGIPCFILGTVSTLLQKWYHQLDWGEPYYLYSVSNIGSMLCLLAYPFLIEPFLNIQNSLIYWRYLLIADGLLLFICCLVFYKLANHRPITEKKVSKISYSQYLEWVVYSALGTMLLVSVTQHMTSDIAPIPLLWLVPLLLYLLTFVLNFSRFPFYNEKTRVFYIVCAQVLSFFIIFDTDKTFDDLAFYLFALFFACMVIHGQLYLSRPNGYFLPSFYLLISFGGMLGSLIVNFLFPNIFDINIDSTISLCLFIFICFFIINKYKIKIFHLSSMDRNYRFLSVVLCTGLILNLFFFRDSILDKRNFYGPISLERYTLNENKALRLLNGVIIHGFQFESADKKTIPTSYYNYNSPFALAMDLLRSNPDERSIHLGGIGLGIGTIATYLGEKDKVSFYEIDPKVITIAKDHFSYLKDSKAKVDIHTGDGRLILDRQENQVFDLLLVDAFNSDAVPTHLLTSEAFEIYFRHLEDEGLLLFHLSNRFLELSKVCEVNAKKLGVESVTLLSKSLNAYQTDALYCLLIRSDLQKTKLMTLLNQERFKNIRVVKNDLSGVHGWSDSFSNIYSILKVE